MRIAIDALGGDFAPTEVLRGLSQALLSEEFSSDQILLVGPETEIEQFLRKEGIKDFPEILHTDQVIEGHEKPIQGLKAKPNASISLCVGAVKKGAADALIAFGNTGAAVAAASMGLGMLPGIRRPGISVVLNGSAGRFVFLDAGANPAPKVEHLFQYGMMGDAYARDILGIPSPRIALMNIGGEASKGSPVIKEAYGMLKDSPLNFVGNIEGNHVFFGEADVIVADGYAGNMILKVIEGFAEYLAGRASCISDDTTEGVKGNLRRLFGAANYAEVGGALLMGVNGIVLIGHGRSKASAILPALQTVRADIEKGVNRHITENIAALVTASESAQPSKS
jgi:glycerol-3-phosphate acyltransferase PlsX